MSANGSAETPQIDSVLSGWRYRALLISVLLSALGYLLFAVFSGWREVAAAIAQVGAFGLVIALSLSLLNYGLRFMRWQLYLWTLGHGVAWRRSLQIYLAGFALTTTPGKAGEAFRGVLLKRRGVPYPDSFAAFFSERLSDLIAIVLLTLFGLTTYPDARPLIYLGGALALVVLVVVSRRGMLEMLQRLLRRRVHTGRLVRHLFEILFQARRCQQPVLLAMATILSVIGWAAEALAFFLILNWIGIEVTPAFAAFVFALSMLAGALSFTPGGLGSTEGVMAGLLIWSGATVADAVAATMLFRGTTLWFAVGIGLAAVSISNVRRSIEPADDVTGSGEA